MNPNFLDKDLAHRLGHAGLVPFILLALGCWLADPAWLGVFVKGQLAYGILVLSFLGAIHWGAAITTGLDAESTRRALLSSVVPALCGWVATMIGGFGFALLIAAFAGVYQVDKRLYPLYGVPDWFLRLRYVLTCVVVVSLVLTVVAANVRG